jgi:hypothetical protein
MVANGGRMIRSRRCARCCCEPGVSILEAAHFDSGLPMSRLFLSRN